MWRQSASNKPVWLKPGDVGRFTFEGVKVMGDKGGKKDKAKKEKQTAAKHTLKEKRKVKKEKQI
jgi:hypothetical protein|tara:strand:+ start:1950 stop:2141 length:192 start_codon:yes stop_codon:yes gene_type:complete